MLLAIIATALAALVQGCLGFGAGILSIGFLSLLWDVKSAAIVLAPVGWVMVVSLAIQLRRDATIRPLIPIFFGIPVGVAGGIAALESLPSIWLKMMLGLTLVAFVLQATIKPPTAWSGTHPIAALTAGTLSGFAGGALSSAGPPVLVYAALAGWPRDRFRANLQMIFLVVSSISVIGYSVQGFFRVDTLQTSALLVPGVMTGAVLGAKIAPHIPQKTFRSLVIAGLALMGCYFTASPWLVI